MLFVLIRFSSNLLLYFLNSFAYKETDIIQSVKDDFIENSRAYYELNSFLGSKSKILHFSDDFKQEEINKLKSDDFKGFLKSQINNHLNKVTSILTSLGCQDTTAWLYKIITGMPRLVEENKYDCSDKAKITQFEVSEPRPAPPAL